jgi:hypothetical protein
LTNANKYAILKAQYERSTINPINYADTGLVVVDLIAANERCGNEFVRMNIDEDKMLAHTCKPKGKHK